MKPARFVAKTARHSIPSTKHKQSVVISCSVFFKAASLWHSHNKKWCHQLQNLIKLQHEAICICIFYVTYSNFIFSEQFKKKLEHLLFHDNMDELDLLMKITGWAWKLHNSYQMDLVMRLLSLLLIVGTVFYVLHITVCWQVAGIPHERLDKNFIHEI